MPPEPPSQWQPLRRVVLLSVVEDGTALSPVLQELCAALPDVAFTLVTPTPMECPGKITGVSWVEWGLVGSDAGVGYSLIDQLQSRAFEAAIVWTPPGRSPHALAYCCYLAGIPIRVGQSPEFGGGVLSPWVRPPLDPLPPTEYYLHLLRSAEILAPAKVHS